MHSMLREWWCGGPLSHPSPPLIATAAGWKSLKEWQAAQQLQGALGSKL